VRVRVGVPEGDVGRIDVGAPAIVRVPALDGTFSGRVSLIGVTADPATRSYMVEISVANPSLRLRAGMVAEATISTNQSVSAHASNWVTSEFLGPEHVGKIVLRRNFMPAKKKAAKKKKH